MKLALVSRVAVGFLFLAAAAAKTRLYFTPPASETVVSDWIGSSTFKLTALVVGEAGIGLWLLSGYQPAVSAIVAIVLLSGFTGVLLRELARTNPRGCGCFAPAVLQQSVEQTRSGLRRSVGVNVLAALICGVMLWKAAPVVNRREVGVAVGASGTRAGFTAIELMVCIAVIAILLALLLPALARSRAQAHNVRCGNNLRHLGSALNSYASDHRGYVPRNPAYYPNHPVWPVVLRRYLGGSDPDTWRDVGTEAFRCAANPTQGVPATYVINGFAFETQGYPRPWWGSPAVNASQIRQPSRLPFFLETPNLFNSRTAFPEFDDIFFEIRLGLHKPAHVTPGKGCRVDMMRHFGRSSNVAFADGHVEVVEGGTLKLENFDDGIRARRWDSQ